MIDFWNERYSSEEYAYGEAPNHFFKQKLLKINPGKILFPAEGEGRNAVFAATMDWKVLAFDPSTEGKRKAELLAAKKKVKIDYRIAGYENFEYPKESIDCLVLIFAHMHPEKRKKYHQKLASYLKPGGTLILEGFSKKQISRNSGGPKNIEMLFSVENLKDDFSFFTKLNISETEVLLDEGPFHKGIASVVQIIGTK